LPRRGPPKTLPFSPTPNERGLKKPLTYTSTLNPGGSLSFAVGHLSGAGGVGGGALGAHWAAPSFPSGRAIKGGSSGRACVGVGAAACGTEAGGCWAKAGAVSREPAIVPASKI